MNEETIPEPIAVDAPAPSPEPEVDPPAAPAPVAAAPAIDPLAEVAKLLEGPLADLREQVGVLANTAKKFASVGAALSATEATQDANNRIRDALLDKVEASRPNFHLQLLRPFVQRLGNLADSLADWGRSPPTDADGFAKCLASLNQQMREMLALHGVLEVRPAAGDPLDPRCHFVSEARPTSDATFHERVAAVLEHGYQYYGQHDRSGLVVPTLIRPARVVTWKHDPSLATNPTN